jgi:hypothetical protein
MLNLNIIFFKFLFKFNSLKAILEIYKKIIINPLIYKIKIMNEIHAVLLIKLIIKVIDKVCAKIIKFDLIGDFIIINVIVNIKLIIKISFKIQYIF